MPLRYPEYKENEILERPRFVDKQIITDKHIYHYDSYIPDVIIKPTKMIHTKLKLALIVLGFILYIYLIIFFKTMYVRTKRLEHIMEMALDAEKEMLKLHEMDNDLGKKIETLEEMLNRN